MKIYSRTNHPPDKNPALVNSFTHAYNRVEAVSVIKGLWLALEEARSVDEHRIGHESDKLADLWALLTYSPHDHIAIVMAWRSFRLPMMVDGLRGAHEQATEAMEAFLES